MPSSSSHSLSRLPSAFSPLTSYKPKLSIHSTHPIILNPTSRLSASTSNPPTNKWTLSCFKHEESFSGRESESVEDQSANDLVKHECGQSNATKTDWVSELCQDADAIFNVKPWTVPWTAKTIVQVMLLWIASFWLVGSWVVPFLAHTAGFRKESLSYRGQALYSLLTDVAEGLAGTAIIYRCLARFRPLPSDWFRFSLKGKWQIDVVLGCLVIPLVNRLSQVNLNLFPVLPSTPVTISNVEQSIVARDPVAMAMYAVVVSVCAPIWEEIVFSGFFPPFFDQIHAHMVLNFG